MSDLVGLLVLLVVVVAALVALVRSLQPGPDPVLHGLPARRLVSIADFPEGRPARIVGRVVDGPCLTAPLSGRACVFYEVVVEEYRSMGKLHSWHPIIQEADGVPFVLDDGTGLAHVDPDGAGLAVRRDSITESGTFDEPTQAELEFLARHGQQGKGVVFNRALRYREGALEIGETIAVAGVGVREPDPDGAARATGYRDGPPTIVHLASSPGMALLISDHADTKR